jgi:hypothetical protein
LYETNTEWLNRFGSLIPEKETTSTHSNFDENFTGITYNKLRDMCISECISTTPYRIFVTVKNTLNSWRQNEM